MVDSYLRGAISENEKEALESVFINDKGLQSELDFHKEIHKIVIDAQCLEIGHLTAKHIQKQKIIKISKGIFIVGSLAILVAVLNYNNKGIVKNDNNKDQQVTTTTNQSEILTNKQTKVQNSNIPNHVNTTKIISIPKDSSINEPFGDYQKPIVVEERLNTEPSKDVIVMEQRVDETKKSSDLQSGFVKATHSIPTDSNSFEKYQPQKLKPTILFDIVFDVSKDFEIELPIEYLESGSYKIFDVSGKMLDEGNWQSGEKPIWNASSKIHLFITNSVYTVVINDKNGNATGIGKLNIMQ